MHVLLITQEPPFDAGQVATGNALRTLQLRQALASGGHTTRQIWLDATGAGAADTFRDRDRLQGQIRADRADAIIVGYWELLGMLPYNPGAPVILDFVAPRPLERLFERPDAVAPELRRLRTHLSRCDLVLVGNADQEKLLAFTLLEAGFDLRAARHTLIVPPGGELVEHASADPGKEGWTLVGGGVAWPWRDAGEYVAALRQAEERHPGRLRLALFGGPYPLHAGERGAEPLVPGGRELASYAEYSAFLSRRAHIGLELAADNIERRFSQSFRALDFLRHGLPLICNEWLPVANDIRSRQAGWTVREPGELPGLLDRILDDPEEWRRRGANAQCLVEEKFVPERAAAALLEWLQAPVRAERLPAWGSPAPAAPVLGVPPLRDRLARRYRLARRVLLNRLLCRGLEAGPGEGIVMVTRGDLEPADHGAAVKIMETARALARQGREVGLVTDSRREYWWFKDEQVVRLRIPLWLRLLSRPLAMVKLDHYTRDIPESNAFLYLPLSDGSFFWRALYVAGQVRARLFQAEFPAYAQPCLEAAAVREGAVVLVEHNVEYERLRRQVPELSDDQYQRLRAIEIDLCNRSDAVVCVSDNDRARLAEDGVHPGLLHTIPHGIDLAAHDRAAPLPFRDQFGIPEGEPLLVYHGTFAYPPNRDALQVMADEILPRLERSGIRAHLLAVGHHPPETPLHPRIHCTGSVEEVAPCLKAADLAVIPLREGGGTRMKIVECFAAGIPVISTSKGIEGIPVIDGEHAIIVDHWDGMCAAIRQVLQEDALRARLVAAGRTLAASLDWTAIGARYVKLYNTVRP